MNQITVTIQENHDFQQFDVLSPVVQQHAEKPIKVSHLLVSAPTRSESDHQSIPPLQKWLPGSLSCLPSLDQAVEEDDDVIVTTSPCVQE